ncbi:hypothetical protein JVU11DRAFT_472 [Chiua virens]|nr:hypothetical protein JVU11DRAFT_472 [Chiua virens]
MRAPSIKVYFEGPGTFKLSYLDLQSRFPSSTQSIFEAILSVTMSSTFTPSKAIDTSKEKDWPMHLGMLDWDNSKIVFTKRSLLEFLKYTGVTVDPGFTNIQKLPRYAQFGNMVADSASEEISAELTNIPVQPAGIQQLFEEEVTDDALATAPQPSPTAESSGGGFKPTRRVRTIPGGTDSIGSIFSHGDSEQFVPTRRVRQRPGGEDNIEGLF